MNESEFIKMMKRKQFVDDIKGWTRGFTFVCMKEGEIFIGHRINGVGKLTSIQSEDLDMFIQYFDRI